MATIRDNELIFKFINLDVTRATYTIREYSIPKDQMAPDFEKNYVNVEREIDIKTGKIVFQVGRKGNKEAAAFFSQKAGDYRNTFNDNPDDLNFAFSGDLKIEYKANLLGRKTVKYSDVLIGQGHTAFSNNWWFGGKDFVNTGCLVSNLQEYVIKFLSGIDLPDKAVLMMPILANTVILTGKRGGNDVNEIQIEKFTTLDKG